MHYFSLLDDLIYTAVLTVGFNPTDYMVKENETGVFIVELSVPADREVNVTLATSDGTALGWLLWLFLFLNI